MLIITINAFSRFLYVACDVTNPFAQLMLYIYRSVLNRTAHKTPREECSINRMMRGGRFSQLKKKIERRGGGGGRREEKGRERERERGRIKASHLNQILL